MTRKLLEGVEKTSRYVIDLQYLNEITWITELKLLV